MNNARKLTVQMIDKLIDEYRAMIPCDQLEIARCLKQKSMELFDDGEKSSAFEVLTQAYEIPFKLPHKKERRTLHIEIADEFQRSNYPKGALDHYEELLTRESVFATNDIRFALRLCNHVGTVYEDIDDNEQALKY